jgi:predicted permease
MILKYLNREAMGIRIAWKSNVDPCVWRRFLTLLQDLSFAFRQLFKHRIYALTAIASMALGIGATAAVYSVLYGVLIDPYPYRDAKRLAFVTIHDKRGSHEIPFTLAEIDQLRQMKSIEGALGQNDESMVATDSEIPQSVKALEISGSGFHVLGAPPLIGRVFTASEAPEGVAPPSVAVISDLFWKSHFASAPDVVGKILELNQHKYTVIGVVGPRFTWHDSEVYLPMPAGMDPKRRFETLVRLRPGVSNDAATGELAGFVKEVGRAEPSLLPKDGYGLKVETLNDWLLGQFKGTLLVLFAAVALLLLIGCGNVSILMLARGTARMQELATRLAVGASRMRIVRQLLTESTILSMIGGIFGMALAYAAVHLIVSLLPEYSIPHEVVISLNVPVLLFSTAVSIVVGILAGLSPALQFSSPHISQMVQSSGTRSTTSYGARTRSALIAGQIALTVLMLAGAGAAMRNFLQAYAAPLGFDTHNILMLDLAIPDKTFTTWQAGATYHDALLERIKATPGVTSVASSLTGTPPRGRWLQSVQVVGSELNKGLQSNVALVSMDYFSVLGIPVLEGRTPTREEDLHGGHVAVVSRTFVDRYFGGADPIGKLIVPAGFSELPSEILKSPNLNEPFRIVGVARDVRNDGLHRPILPQVYLPSSIIAFRGDTLLVRTAGNPAALIHEISVNLRALNQNQAVYRATSFDEFFSMFVWSHERFIATVFGVFSFVALGLAAIGISSLVAYSVEQRTREFGIRMALGAPRWNVLLLNLASTARTIGAGLVLGILLSIGLSDSVQRWTESSMRDASVLGIIAMVFLLASGTACILPARRATRIDPAIALRDN